MSVVLITGCSSGFGLGASLTFARQGHTTFATVRNLDSGKPLQVAAEEEGLDLHVLRLDVRDAESVDAAVDEIVERAGRIDICVNNAGFELKGPIEETADDEVLAQFDTNVFGLLRVVRAVLPVMREQGSGVIVNMSSVAGLVSRPFGGIYAASKHAVEAISEALHLEVSRFGIRVAIVEPGQFATDLRDKATVAAAFDEHSPYWDSADHFENALGRLVPDGKPAPPEMVSEAIVQIAEDDEASLRQLVGADADLIMSVRNAGDFEQYEETMRQALDWWD